MPALTENKKTLSEINQVEKMGGSIVFIESNFNLRHDFDKTKINISKSDEYTLENLISNFRSNYEKNKKDEVAFYLWGGALFSLKRYKEAIEKFEKALSINPNYYEVYVSLANTLLKIGKYKLLKQVVLSYQLISNRNCLQLA